MRIISNNHAAGLMLVMAMLPISTAVSAQQQGDDDPSIIVNGVATPAPAPAQMTEGPKVKGVITARQGDAMKIMADDGTTRIVAFNDATKIKAGAGLFGNSLRNLSGNALLNGLPVEIETVQGGGQLLATQVEFRKSDLKTATMIHNATDQRFTEQAAATEQLRGRVGDIDKYNIKSTTNVHFDVGKADLSPEDKAQLCSAASSAEAQENALLLVVGYTDSTGGEEINQTLSEKRAARVINYLQQACGWKPYRMLTPTGMAEADPLADNDTAEGKAQNRRVAVNVLVSKSVDNM
ncbi:OmpA family protein [Sphingomonas sp. ID0503]|uniref:OmpA family protein n=1 Tax=Sphingomonas sp. ID0503 TaxID=3399691 RepID=UPI003AFA23CE